MKRKHSLSFRHVLSQLLYLIINFWMYPFVWKHLRYSDLQRILAVLQSAKKQHAHTLTPSLSALDTPLSGTLTIKLTANWPHASESHSC